MRIACPKCDFSPSPHMRWQCRPGCGYRWHTFATHGICPVCSKVWHDTQCPNCRLWSPIDEWYREDLPVRQPGRREREPLASISFHQETDQDGIHNPSLFVVRQMAGLVDRLKDSLWDCTS